LSTAIVRSFMVGVALSESLQGTCRKILTATGAKKGRKGR
jgi:hypothetical protein